MRDSAGNAACDSYIPKERKKETRMTAKHTTAPPTSTASDGLGLIRRQYNCGPVEFAGTDTALYDRHLIFDHVVKIEATSDPERFEAFARSVRDILSQRWVLTDDSYERENPKRVYYLSMEFLIGRSLANNVMNLGLNSLAEQAVKEKNLDWLSLLEPEPDAGLGNGGLGRLAACFIESLATLQIPAMGYGLRYEYGIFRQVIENDFQVEYPDHWLALPDPWEVSPAPGNG
jgi:starch phosphorylase